MPVNLDSLWDFIEVGAHDSPRESVLGEGSRWPIRDQSEYAPLLDLRDVISILRRRVALIGVTLALVLSTAVTYLVFATPYFTASTEILIDPRKKHTVEREVVPSGLGSTAGENFALVDSQVKVIQSDAVLRPVVVSHHLVDDPEFTKGGLLGRILAFVTASSATPAVSASPEDRVLLGLEKRLAVKRDSEVICHSDRSNHHRSSQVSATRPSDRRVCIWTINHRTEFRPRSG